MNPATPDLLPEHRKRRYDASPLPHRFDARPSHSHSRPSQRRRRWPFYPLLRENFFAFDMGNFVSALLGGWRSKDDGLEMYKSWCDAPSRDLTVATDEETGTGQHLLDRITKDWSRKAALEAAKGSQRQKREPHYKKAHQKSKQNDSRLEEIGIEVKFQEEKLAGIQKPDKAAKEDLSELFKTLTDEEEGKVHDCFDDRGPSSKVLVLHGPSNIEISKEKFQCLKYGRWLNDEVINLYLELLKEREKREPKKFLKCHFFNTFFYKKLACGKNGYDYKSVKRWTTRRKLGYDLIECDKIFVPVHKDVHWCLAIINMKENTFQYLDSLGGMDHNVLNMLARYIAEEVKDKSNKVIDTSSWREEIVDDIPLQQNGSLHTMLTNPPASNGDVESWKLISFGPKSTEKLLMLSGVLQSYVSEATTRWDCGMFMLKYIDFHSRGLRLSFSQKNMEYFRRRTAKEILKLRAD